MKTLKGRVLYRNPRVDRSGWAHMITATEYTRREFENDPIYKDYVFVCVVVQLPEELPFEFVEEPSDSAFVGSYFDTAAGGYA